MFTILFHESMTPFYQNITAFPTVLLTFGLAICVLYWLVAVLGLVDIEVLDVDMDLAGTKSSASTLDALAGLLMKWGLQGVPVTIILSLLILFAWMICYYLAHGLSELLSSGWLRYIVGAVILLVSLYLATYMTAFVIKPIRPLFQRSQQSGLPSIIGQTAVVRSSKVTRQFGEAFLNDGGAGLILKVRCSDDDEFKKGDKVVLLNYESGHNVYRVILERDFIG